MKSWFIIEMEETEQRICFYFLQNNGTGMTVTRERKIGFLLHQLFRGESSEGSVCKKGGKKKKIAKCQFSLYLVLCVRVTGASVAYARHCYRK